MSAATAVGPINLDEKGPQEEETSPLLKDPISLEAPGRQQLRYIAGKESGSGKWKEEEEEGRQKRSTVMIWEEREGRKSERPPHHRSQNTRRRGGEERPGLRVEGE